jgi:alpha-L-rhamnosidase
MRNIFLFFLAALISGSDLAENKAPSGLMVEFIREPAGVRIMDLKPEFTWILPTSSLSQKAYQILIASSEEILNKDKADIWNSGKTNGKGSAEVESGVLLKSDTRYFWKVKIWNEKGFPSPYSSIQAFQTGTVNEYSTTSNRFQSNLIPPVKFKRKTDGSYFADFGKDAFGSLLLNLTSSVNDTLIVHLGEKLSEADKIDRNPGGTIRYQKIKLAVKKGSYKYQANLAVDKRNTSGAAVLLPDSLGIVTPFRYCEIENTPVEIKAENIRQKALWYYFDDNTSSFSSSDTILNHIWDLSKYSMKATSFAGLYVDGDRERIPYEADAYINQLGHYYTDREYTIARRTNEYFIGHPTWPTEWLLQTVPMFYNDFMYTGNIESVKKYYKELKAKTLIALAREDGLISAKNCTDEIMESIGFKNKKERLRDIVDWPPAQKDTGWKLITAEGERDGYDMVEINTVVNAFHYQNMVLMAVLAGKTGEATDSAFFTQRALMIRKSFNEKLLDNATGIYVDGENSKHSSLHANMMALAVGLVPEENKTKVISFIKSRGMACSVYGSQYLLEGLYNAGESEYAFSLITSTGDRSWWNMIKSGSTIAMEAWDMKYKPNSDWNHSWGAAPANIIPKYMWGIGPAEPGYSKVIIKPQLGSLRHSSVSVPTIRGNIEANFKLNDGILEFQITIPPNMVCDFVLPAKGEVLLNGKATEPKSGVIKLLSGLNYITII